MEISPTQYLELMDRIKVLEKENEEQRKDNRALTDEIIKQRNTIEMVQKSMKEKEEQHKLKQKQMATMVEEKMSRLMFEYAQFSNEQKQHYEDEIKKIKDDANYQKMKEMQKKMTQNRFSNHQLSQFHYHLKTLYRSWTKKKTQPTFAELLRWVNDKKTTNESSRTSKTKENKKPKNMKKSTISKNIPKPKKLMRKMTLEKPDGTIKEYSYEDILASSSSRKIAMDDDKQEVKINLISSEVMECKGQCVSQVKIEI